MKAGLGLGSNLGDRQAHLAAGLKALETLGTVLPSPLVMETPDESGIGPAYLNTVALVVTEEGDPRRLLEGLLRLELNLGRDRAQGRNAPRTLDLDVLLYGQARIDSPHLTVPHPRMWQRAFVLRPLADVAPEWVSAEQLLAVQDQSVDVMKT